MPFVDDEYLLFSRAGRRSGGHETRASRMAERQAYAAEAARLARPRLPPTPLIVRVPLPRPIHLVPRVKR